MDLLCPLFPNSPTVSNCPDIIPAVFLVKEVAGKVDKLVHARALGLMVQLRRYCFALIQKPNPTSSLYARTPIASPKEG